jgi:uncharacterized membrane protein
MSELSQTGGRRTLAFGPRFLISMAITAIILWIALRGAWPMMVEKAASATPHGPDMALFARLPLAVQLHIFGAVGALGLGSVLLAVRKGRMFHRVAGWTWVALVALVAGSSMFIQGLNGGKLSVLHAFTAITLVSLPLAVMWAKRHEVNRHRSAMMGLFYGAFAVNMFIAFIPGRTMWNLFFG